MARYVPATVAIVLAAALAGAGARSGSDGVRASEFPAPGTEAIALTAARSRVTSHVRPEPGTGFHATSEPSAGQRAADEPLDRILDLYVRDGLVYYRALRSERAVLDRYVRSLRAAPAGFGDWTNAQQVAFWINSYNALVLRTVIDHYPIRGGSPLYPPDSIRQIPGAFERIRHTVAGRQITLDQIESAVLATFGDPRVFLALGRGAVGSGRLRSEAFSAGRLESQLEAAAEEFATEPWGVILDRMADAVQVSAVFGWRQEEFVQAYADRGWTDSGRSPIERAVLNLIEPSLFPGERAFLANNTFSFAYQDFDWRLNDLTGGRP